MDSSGVTHWVADTRVHVKGLQPNTVYAAIATDIFGGGGGSFINTDKNGVGAARFSWATSNPFPVPVEPTFYEVYLVNPDGSLDALVLSGP